MHKNYLCTQIKTLKLIYIFIFCIFIFIFLYFLENTEIDAVKTENCFNKKTLQLDGYRPRRKDEQ